MSKISVYNPTTSRALRDLKKYKVKAHGFSSDDVKNGNKEALWAVGCEYELMQKYPQAMYWYRLAAEKNFAKAENNIGMLYNYGNGVSADYSLAMGWYLKAAKKYNQDAFSNIGALFEVGNGITENKYKALEWYSKYHKDSFLTTRLTDQGYYLDPSGRDKSNDDLIRETEVLIEYERLNKINRNYNPVPQTESGFQLLELQTNSQLKDQTFKKQVEKQLQTNIEKMNQFESSFQELQIITESNQAIITSLKQTKQTLKHGKNKLANEIQLLLGREKSFEKRIKERDDEVKSLRQDGQKQLAITLKQARYIESLLDTNHTMKLEKKKMEHENQTQRQLIYTLEQQLNTKEDVMDLLMLKGNIPESSIDKIECKNEVLKSFEKQLKTRSNENDLVKQKIQLSLDIKKKKNKMLEQKIGEYHANLHNDDFSAALDEQFSNSLNVNTECDSQESDFDTSDCKPSDD